MHSYLTVGFAATLISLAAASPASRPQPSFSILTTRQEGSCGGTTGNTCAAGYCCSQYGYCGQGEAYCGSGGGSSGGGGGSSGGSGLGDKYTFYSGDGSSSSGWPPESDWASFDHMWSANSNNMLGSCSQFSQADDSQDELNDIQSAIISVAGSAGVDERFVLAVVLQESGGCVRAPTTNYGVNNPGLMQSHSGAGTCNSGGNVQNPCPQSEITQMIEDGTEGTSSGDGLEQCLQQAPNQGTSQQYYEAARIYNSGSIASNGNLGDGVATHCYASDIANRLTGWVNAQNTCTLDN